MSVYFISAPSVGLVKIGYSKHPKTRAKQIGSASPVPVFLLGFVEATPKLERQLHEHLIAHHHRDEWFWMNAEVHQCIEAVIAGTLDHATLPIEGKRAWALVRRASSPISPNGKPYRAMAA